MSVPYVILVLLVVNIEDLLLPSHDLLSKFLLIHLPEVLLIV